MKKSLIVNKYTVYNKIRSKSFRAFQDWPNLKQDLTGSVIWFYKSANFSYARTMWRGKINISLCGFT